MPKIRTQDLIGPALDWAVAVALGDEGRFRTGGFRPSTNWSQGGPIIDDEDIAVGHRNSKESPDNKFSASKLRLHPWPIEARGPTKLIAAMRCFVASRLGDEVEVPEELLQ